MGATVEGGGRWVGRGGLGSRNNSDKKWVCAKRPRCLAMYMRRSGTGGSSALAEYGGGTG